jgi:superkiller protein 8
VGFGGEAKVWGYHAGMWVQEGGELETGDEMRNQGMGKKKRLKVGEIWAVALSAEGRYLAGTSYDGRIGVWDLLGEGRRKIREYETKGSFGLCVDMVRCALILVLFINLLIGFY